MFTLMGLLLLWHSGSWTLLYHCTFANGTEAAAVACGYEDGQTLDFPTLEAAEDFGYRHPEIAVDSVKHREQTFPCSSDDTSTTVQIIPDDNYSLVTVRRWNCRLFNVVFAAAD
jgi:hypothetical protein